MITLADAIEAVGQTHLALSTVALKLDCSKQWVSEHIDEFPNRWRMASGEWRIPSTDVDALARRNRIKLPT